MGLEKKAEKLDEYFKRLKSGKAEEIKPSHVEKVIQKLEAKEVLLVEELEQTSKSSKIERLESKLAFVREQIERAKWLLEQITAS